MVTWKDRLVELRKNRFLRPREQAEVDLLLRRPVGEEIGYQMLYESMMARLEARGDTKVSLALTDESLTCTQCGATFDAQVVYIFGHRQGRDWCPDCNRAEREEEQARAEAQRQAEIAATRRKWRLSCGIPHLYQSKDFSNFDPSATRQVYDVCKKYANNFPLPFKSPYSSLFLYSNDVWGNGKTHLAAAIGHRILDRWQGEEITCPVMFISEPEIYARIQETYSFSQEERQMRPSEQQIINKLVAVKLLVLDDLGKQERRDMDFVRRTLFDIVNRRYNQGRPVVITSNKDGAGLKRYLGDDEAILDRLWEMTEGNRHKVGGKSYRRRA